MAADGGLDVNELYDQAYQPNLNSRGLYLTNSTASPSFKTAITNEQIILCPHLHQEQTKIIDLVILLTTLQHQILTLPSI